jgi:hypothetical protein
VDPSGDAVLSENLFKSITVEEIDLRKLKLLADGLADATDRLGFQVAKLFKTTIELTVFHGSTQVWRGTQFHRSPDCVM